MPLPIYIQNIDNVATNLAAGQDSLFKMLSAQPLNSNGLYLQQYNSPPDTHQTQWKINSYTFMLQCLLVVNKNAISTRGRNAIVKRNLFLKPAAHFIFWKKIHATAASHVCFFCLTVSCYPCKNTHYFSLSVYTSRVGSMKRLALTHFQFRHREQ